MKRVEGVSWRAVLRDSMHALWSRVPGDRLDWHLRILVQVCNAIEFAHSQHIITVTSSPTM
jgi:serine/threonine-protein kinase